MRNRKRADRRRRGRHRDVVGIFRRRLPDHSREPMGGRFGQHGGIDGRFLPTAQRRRRKECNDEIKRITIGGLETDEKPSLSASLLLGRFCGRRKRQVKSQRQDWTARRSLAAICESGLSLTNAWNSRSASASIPSRA